MRGLLVVVAVVFSACPSKSVFPDAGPLVVKETAPMVPVKKTTLEVTLLPAEGLTAGKPIQFRQRVRNSTGVELKFCRYHTLFEGLRNDVLDVKNGDGIDLDYRGMMAKRAPPGPEDFITVAPGAEVVSEWVDVSEGYAFTAGKFTVVFPGGGISELPSSSSIVVEVK